MRKFICAVVCLILLGGTGSFVLAQEGEFDFLIELFAREEEYRDGVKQVVEENLPNYPGAELYDFSLFLDDSYAFGEAAVESIATINVRLSLDLNKSRDRLKNTLEIYSDDLAVAIHEKYPDTPIDSLCIFWQVPSFTDDGNAAKYMYYTVLDKLFLDNASGPLYTW